MRKIRLLKSTSFPIAVFFVSILLLAESGFAGAQSSGFQFFPETGHTVRGDFLAFYTRSKDPLLVFGYPITEEMISRDGKTVQYFQRSRLERVADSSGSLRIQRTPLGLSLYKPGDQRTINNPSACEYFAGTGYSVCFQFLDFFRANGGLEQFGNPISPFEFHNDILVQYFENARLEWRTDGFKGRVVITDLGRIYFDVLGEDTAQLRPIGPTNATINPVLGIKVRAFVSRPVARPGGEQTVFIIVRSQTGQAVANASGIATVRLTDGTLQTHRFTTDTRGMGQISFSFNNQTAGKLVPIEIVVSYQNLTGATSTSFRIWL